MVVVDRCAVSTAQERRRCLVGLIGTGISLSLTPAMHELEGDALGLRYLYQTIDLETLGIDPEESGGLLMHARRLGFAGLNVTHPCKRIIAREVDELSPDAELISSVNTVVFENGRAIGHNTDGSAFAMSLERGLPSARLRCVVVVGAGGAGSAICLAALRLGVERLTVVDAVDSRAHRLAAVMQGHFGPDRCVAARSGELPSVIAHADGVINATPVGMAGTPGTPFDPNLLRPEHWVADIVYRPLETELLAGARARGCETLDGGGMAVLQAVDAFRLFAGRAPDPERMFGHFGHLAALAGDDVHGLWWTSDGQTDGRSAEHGRAGDGVGRRDGRTQSSTTTVKQREQRREK
jgi:shikimate dehydrogenase